jgi:hypothetical protein
MDKKKIIWKRRSFVKEKIANVWLLKEYGLTLMGKGQ